MTVSTGPRNGFRSAGPAFWLVCSVLMWAGASPSQVGGQAPAKKIVEVKKPPQLPEPPASTAGATTVGEESCLDCHKEKKAGYVNSLHSKAADPRTPGAAQGCETCHGPGSKHVDDPEKNKMRVFRTLGSDATTAVCTTCHTSGEHALWAGSKHEARRVACTTCHSVHNSKGEKLIKTETQPKLCASCHQNIVNKLNRFNHMPVREDKMMCSSCHNTHGSANVKMLRTGTTVDEACASCHAEKRGPYLWEHAPVANACVTCHDPHGSSNERMLVSKVPFLCQRCHVTSRHPPTVYDGFIMKTSSNGNKITGRGCVICHSQIHGSNAPTGKALLR
jgi:DmsE family decaheme c-type cytochrome